MVMCFLVLDEGSMCCNDCNVRGCFSLPYVNLIIMIPFDFVSDICREFG